MISFAVGAEHETDKEFEEFRQELRMEEVEVSYSVAKIF